MRKSFVVLLVLLGAFLATMPRNAAAAAYPETHYYVSAGTHPQIWVDGNLIWYNRTIKVGGKLHTTSSCAAVVYTARNSDNGALSQERREACTTTGHGFTLAAQVPGGAAYVMVDLWVKTTSGWVKAGDDLCTRTDGCG